MFNKFGKDLPDADLAIDVGDGIKHINLTKKNNTGLYTGSTIDGSNMVPVPDFSFYDWHETILKGSNLRSHVFSYLLDLYENIYSTHPWDKRNDKLFFRGAPAVCE